MENGKDEQWKDLARQLGEELATLDDGEFLIVAIRGTNLYVQFGAQESFGIRAEATSNHYLPEHARLDGDQHVALLAMGWRPPMRRAGGAGSEVPAGSPNYSFDVPPLDSYAGLAQMAVKTLRTVFGATDVRQLEFGASGENDAAIRSRLLSIPMPAA